MIKRIELWNWESHEHTVVRDLDPAFNLIWGDSDAGKSSIVRALKLVAHNQFDPESVRVGASDAEVEVETERGVVHVTRGKKNIWKVTTEGKPAQIFDKIGKKPLPEAVEVLGLGMVELGDMSMSVNLMDQAEAHFMLAEFDGSNATGSARAQVIDEISGLSGIEGLIKEVSLDCHRFGRSIKDDEDKLEAIEAQMHDADALKREKTTLVDVRSALQDHVDFDAAANLATQTHDEHEQLSREHADLTLEMAQTPDPNAVRGLLEAISQGVKEQSNARSLHDVVTQERVQLRALEANASNIPDVDKAASMLDVSRSKMEMVAKVAALFDTHQDEADALDRLRAELKVTDGVDQVTRTLRSVEENGDVVMSAEALLTEHRQETRRWVAIKDDLAVCEKDLDESVKMCDKIKSEFEVCPLTLRPLNPWCLKGTGRLPVTDAEQAAKMTKEQA